MMPLLVLFACLSFAQVDGVQAESDKQALIKRIKQELNQIDETLLEAAEADAVSDELDRVKQSHLDAIRDIEALIKQLEYQFVNPQGGGGGGGGQGGSSGGSQSQQQPQGADSRNQQRSPEGGQTEQEQQAGGTEPSGSEEQPTDGRPSGQPEGSPQPGNSVPPDATDDFSRQDTDGRWGLLPPKVQEQLNNMHVDDVPDRYRAWLDAYIKAMRRLEEP